MTAGHSNRPKDCSAEFDDETGRCERCGLGWFLSSKDWPPCQPMTVARYRAAINREIATLLGSYALVADLAKQGRAANPLDALNRAMEMAAVRRLIGRVLDDPRILQILNPKRHAEDNDSNG